MLPGSVLTLVFSATFTALPGGRFSRFTTARATGVVGIALATIGVNVSMPLADAFGMRHIPWAQSLGAGFWPTSTLAVASYLGVWYRPYPITTAASSSEAATAHTTCLLHLFMPKGTNALSFFLLGEGFGPPRE